MDEITLTIPRERPYNGIAHLVLGGLAARLDVTIDKLEDLQVALAGVLERAGSGGDVTVELRMRDHAIEASVGPFPRGELRAELEHEDSDEMDLRRVLAAVVDRVHVGERGDADWVELRKDLSVRAGES